jgi:hypothetical protein
LIGVCNPSEFTIYVEPLIKELQDEFEALKTHLKNVEENFFGKFKSSSNAVGKPCHVKINDLWHRGEVLEMNRKTAKVFLIDSGAINEYPFEEVRQMFLNSVSMKCPRKIIKAKLNVEEEDSENFGAILKKMTEMIKRRQELKAIIKSFDIDGLPTIELVID